LYADRRPKGSQKAARKLRERCVALDPHNLSAHLKLCKVFESSNKKTEHNRLLDAVAVRFPEHPAILLQADCGCIERKAYPEGLQHLERAAVLDPRIVRKLAHMPRNPTIMLYQSMFR
jgi:hypothetical protein